ncbi:MAG: sensor histidine kinase KdpD [Anaerolineales bacterium]|nr:sensor histidine kinase KdpD [Anaerolineales bacterium]
MKVDQRPNPDELLERLNEEEQRQTRARLKIFLGYVAGVGKTYAMLEAAHQRKEEGVDVVVGYVETHGRKETEALVQGLEVIPRQEIEYRGAALSDMDLDAILSRRPKLVLVDELAHTNAPGMRHPKRYQDVEELLDAGINVYTTVNIQHLESLKDVVQQITGVVIRETVPNRIFDEAYEIELVDLPADELLNRLREGKVYVSDQAVRALQKFFRKGNLSALRELALRQAAERVDSQMLSYMRTKSIPGPWPAGDRIMACISSHPMGERLIRVGRRLADDLDAEWYVVFVETPGHLHMPAQNRLRIQQNLHLADELGAQVVNITSESASDAIIEFAHRHNITKIIAGKPFRARWFEIIRGTVIDQIIRNSGNIDVYVVSEGEPTPAKSASGRLPESITPHQPIRHYVGGLILVVLMTLLGLPLRPYLEPTNIAMLYLVAVILSAVYLGKGPAIFVSVIGVLAFDFFFTEPRLTFTVYDSQYIITFFGLLIVGLMISSSAALLRNQIDILRRREQQARSLNTLSRELTAAKSLNQVLETVIHKMSAIFNRESVILMPEDGHLVVKAATPGFTLSEAETAVADWAYKYGKETGRGTDTLPAAAIRYFPLITAHETVGVLGIKPQEQQNYLTGDQRILMEGVINLAAIAIERASFAEEAAQAEMLRNTEKLQTALLNSISHELRTPLATITGVLSSLEVSETQQPQNQLDAATRLELIHSATHQAERLNHLVGNLLDMTRLEAGAMRLNREPTDVQDLVATVTGKMADGISLHPLLVNIPDDLPEVNVDAVLIGQVLTNLLDNAVKYSKSGDPITISAGLAGQEIDIAVKDCGIGIPEGDLEHVFDKFYRVQRQDAIAGTGLGLSICKGIIEAHGGKIWTFNNPEKGVTITFTLPVAQAKERWDG